MIDKDNVLSILEERVKAGLNDCAADKCRVRIVEELGYKEDDIIEFLDGLEDDDLYLISETFQDIAEKLQSDTFTGRLWEVQNNHTDIDIANDIDATEL